MKTEIQIEMKENIKEMEKLITSQKFRVADAQKYTERYFNIYRALEQTIKSRDNWKDKYLKLKDTRSVFTSDVQEKKGCGETFTFLEDNKVTITMKCGTSHKKLIYLCDSCNSSNVQIANSDQKVGNKKEIRD